MAKAEKERLERAIMALRGQPQTVEKSGKQRRKPSSQPTLSRELAKRAAIECLREHARPVDFASLKAAVMTRTSEYSRRGLVPRLRELLKDAEFVSTEMGYELSAAITEV